MPPRASSALTNASAAARFSGVAATSSVRNGCGSVANGTIPKRSSGPRLRRQKRSAPRACSIFAPAIEPEVSQTKTKSFGMGVASDDAGGESTNRNVPSGPAAGSRWASAVSATGFVVGRQKSRKSRSGSVPRSSQDTRAGPPGVVAAGASILWLGDHTLPIGDDAWISTEIEQCRSGCDENRSVASGYR
ncbi:MAG: hypothetical protein HMLKMBBP_00115 [Planctomycetes bacterium]|nr:hypothetical protein [Planctomycetota bacterium]